MKTTLILLFVALCFANAQENYIHGGGNAFRGAYPSVVSIQHRIFPNMIHMCGGVVLAERWVLTAGTCADTISRIEVVGGRHDLQAREEEQRRLKTWGPSVISADKNLLLVRISFKF